MQSTLITLWRALSDPVVRKKAPHRLTFRHPLLEWLEDRNVPTTFTVLNTQDCGAGSLRQAIIDANTAHTGTPGSPDLIQFNLSTNDSGYQSIGTGWWRIQPTS